MTIISPLQQNFPISTKEGYITPFFKRWTDQILARIGGITGGSYNALAVTLGTFLWDLNANPVAVVTLTNGANVLSPPLNQVAGGPLYRLTMIQPPSGPPGTVTWASAMKFPGGAAPTLSVANGAIDEAIFDSDGTNMKLVVFGKNYS